MTEEEIINKIQKLGQIKPRKEWVFLTKGRILGKKEQVSSPSFIEVMRFIFGHKLAFSALAMLIVLVGTFASAQKSLPGDTLFVIKKVVEKSQLVFLSEEEKPQFNLEQAKKRLDDLTKIAEANKTKKFAPAINEYQASVSKIAEGLTEEKDEKKLKEIVIEIQKLEEKEERVKSLGAIIDRNIEKDYALVQAIIGHIEDLETRTLTEEQQEILVEIREDVENEDFGKALIKSLELTE